MKTTIILFMLVVFLPASSGSAQKITSGVTVTRGVTIGGASSSDGPAQLPLLMSTTMPNLTGYASATICAAACTYTTLTAAMAAVACKTVVFIKHNVTFTADWAGGSAVKILNKSCSSSSWIIWASDDFTLVGANLVPTNLPVAGVRVLPTDKTNMPTLSSQAFANTEVFTCQNAAAYHRFVGLEITETVDQAGALIFCGNSQEGADTTVGVLSDYPANIVFDRCYVHGRDLTSDHVKNGFSFHASSAAVVDSFIESIGWDGIESHGIIYNGPGPFTFKNNAISAGSAYLFSGGVPQAVAGVIPSDVYIGYNNGSRPLKWFPFNSQYWGTPRYVKNDIEWKLVQRALVEYNVMDYVWSGSTQVGSNMVVTPRCDQSGAPVNCPVSGDSPQAVIDDTTIRFNLFRHMGSGFAYSGTDSNDTSHTLRLHRSSVHDNVLLDNNARLPWGALGGRGAWLAWLGGVSAVMDAAPHNVTLNHNTSFESSLNEVGDGTAPGGDTTNLTDTNNLHSTSSFGLQCSGDGYGTPCLTTMAGSSYTFTGNIYPNTGPQCGGNCGTQYPTTNQTCGGAHTCFPDLNDANFGPNNLVDSVNCNAGVFDPVNCALIGGSVYHTTPAPDGADFGANVTGKLSIWAASQTKAYQITVVNCTHGVAKVATAGGDVCEIQGGPWPNINAPTITITLIGTTCSSPIVQYDNTRLWCNSGAHAAGTGDVVVVSAGTTVTLTNGITYTASAPTLSSISLSPASQTLSISNLNKGQGIATCIFSDASSYNCGEFVTWATSDGTKATVSNVTESQGIIVPVAAGSTNITCSWQSITSSADVVTVNP